MRFATYFLIRNWHTTLYFPSLLRKTVVCFILINVLLFFDNSSEQHTENIYEDIAGFLLIARGFQSVAQNRTAGEHVDYLTTSIQGARSIISRMKQMNPSSYSTNCFSANPRSSLTAVTRLLLPVVIEQGSGSFHKALTKWTKPSMAGDPLSGVIN